MYVAHTDVPPCGHTAYQASLLAGMLDQRVHEVGVVAAEDATLPDVSPPHGVFLHGPSRRSAEAAVRRCQPDILLGNGGWSMPRPDGVPTVIVVYEGLFDEPPPWGMYPAGFARRYHALTRASLDGALAAIAISHHTADALRRVPGWSSRPIAVAPPAVASLSALGGVLPPADSYVLSIGWFHPRKDLPLTLRGWARAADAGLQVDLVLAGMFGPDDHVHGSVARRVLEEVGPVLARRVHILGPVTGPEIGSLFRDAAALVISSHHEGFGIPAIEAFSVGTPVVAVNRASLREVVGPVGCVVEPTAAAIADGLRAVVTDPPDKFALANYAAGFTRDRQVGAIISLLESLDVA